MIEMLMGDSAMAAFAFVKERGDASSTAPLSCYLHPDFWRGAMATRLSPEVVTTRIVSEEEVRVGRHTIKRQIVEQRQYAATDEERVINDAMVRSISALERAAGKRDLSTMASYHRWLGRGTKPDSPAVEEE